MGLCDIIPSLGVATVGAALVAGVVGALVAAPLLLHAANTTTAVAVRAMDRNFTGALLVVLDPVGSIAESG
jgi:hypothetical protein